MNLKLIIFKDNENFHFFFFGFIIFSYNIKMKKFRHKSFRDISFLSPEINQKIISSFLNLRF